LQINPAMSYYRTIDGLKMDARLLDLAVEAVKGVGDGRISVQDAHILWDAVKDGGVYTDVEKQTVIYLRKNFRWTQAADEWFRLQEVNWISQEKPLHMTLAELAKEHFAHQDVLETPSGRVARKHRLEMAIAETAQDHEEIGLKVQLADGRVVEVYSNFIEMAGDFVELRGGCAIPLRAIEKIGL
jgi:hypothetical protein